MSNTDNTTRSSRADFLIFFWYIFMVYVAVVIEEQTSDFHTRTFINMAVLAIVAMMVLGNIQKSELRDAVGWKVFTSLKFFIWVGFVSALLATIRPYVGS